MQRQLGFAFFILVACCPFKLEYPFKTKAKAKAKAKQTYTIPIIFVLEEPSQLGSMGSR